MRCMVLPSVFFPMASAILVQETQSAKDIDMTCPKMLPIKATKCLQGGPMSLDWPVDPSAKFNVFQIFAVS